MRGRKPKDPKTRQRRNRAVTAATLGEVKGDAVVPPLPKRHHWLKPTVEWWGDVWQSPMAQEYLPSDIHGLYVLAELMDLFWRNPSTALAAEIRQQRLAFGLTPIDRLRLQWKVKGHELVEGKEPKPTGAQRKVATQADPRHSFLRAVK